MQTIVAVDVQQGFLSDGVPQDLPARIAAFLDRHRDARRIATRYVNGAHSPCRTLMGWTDCEEGSTGAALHPLIAARVGVVVDKQTYGIDLSGHVGVGDQVLVVGLDSDVCVAAIVTTLFDAGVDVRVVVDLCASSGGPRAHDAGLQVLQRVVGADRLVRSENLSVQP